MVFLIPVWNDVLTLPEVVRGALVFGPVWVVDDGSTDGSGAAAAAAGARLLTRPHLGKGAALRHGLSTLGALGETHALTLDADGQHLTSDIPRFIEASRRHPTSLVLGVRPTGLGPIRSRLGRRVSNTLVAHHTGRVVADSQCGMRVYPLEHQDRWMSPSNGYEFELDILLRYAASGRERWTEVPCGVRYPGPARLGWRAAAAILKRGLWPG